MANPQETQQERLRRDHAAKNPRGEIKDARHQGPARPPGK